MMKHCKYCGKELHEFSSFCPYCMNSQIEKQNAVIQKKNSKKWLYFLIIGIALALLIVLVFIFMNDRKELHENNSSIAIESIESTSATSTESALTTVTTTITEPITTEIHTTTTKTITTTTQIETTTVPTETTLLETTIQLGDYLTEGKTSSQIQGYGGYENIGGIILTIEEINETSLTFSIVQYSESGYASDTISARNITAEIIDNKAEFQFSDMLDGKGYGILTFEQGKIHIVTYPNETTSMQTSIIVDEWLS